MLAYIDHEYGGLETAGRSVLGKGGLVRGGNFDGRRVNTGSLFSLHHGVAS